MKKCILFCILAIVTLTKINAQEIQSYLDTIVVNSSGIHPTFRGYKFGTYKDSIMFLIYNIEGDIDKKCEQYISLYSELFRNSINPSDSVLIKLENGKIIKDDCKTKEQFSGFINLYLGDENIIKMMESPIVKIRIGNYKSYEDICNIPTFSNKYLTSCLIDFSKKTKHKNMSDDF